MWRSKKNDAEIIRLWAEPGSTISSIAKTLKTTRGTVDGASRRLGLQFKHDASIRILSPNHPAAENGTTTQPRTLRMPDNNVLKPGGNQRKLGAIVRKGKWKGFPIYSLTLEERATCPRSCDQWLSCYGNHMGRAIRYRHGPELEAELKREVAHLAAKHPLGFVVRLHILGDFYSVPYVVLWSRLLFEHPALHIFGYTHWKRGTKIGDAIATLRDAWWERFAIRTSDAPQDGPHTVVIDHKAKRGDAIICPAQTMLAKVCGTCSLCWASKKPIAFLKH